MRLIRLVSILFLLVFILNFTSARNLYGCQTLDVENEIYVLQNDIAASGTCLTIQANNVYLNLFGHKIVGNGEGTGVLNNGFDSFSVKYGKIENFSQGIYFNNSAHNLVTNNVLSTNDYALSIAGSSNNTFSNNALYHNSNAFLISNSQTIALLNNNISDNKASGIVVDSSTNNSFISNVVFSNENGVSLGSGSSFNEVKDNDITYNKRGISIVSPSNEVYNNNFVENEVQVVNNGGNVWDFSLPIGGNYWSNYDNRDEFCGDSDRDGICDNPLIIDEQNQDHLPFIEFDGWHCVSPTDGFVIMNDTKLCLGSYRLPQGIKINKAGITLDCNYAHIYSPHDAAGITVLQSGVTVKNCIISDYDVGMKTHSSGLIINNTFFNIPGWGMHLKQGNNIIKDNKFESIYISIVAENSNSNKFSNNLIDGGDIFATYGFRFTNSRNNTLINNTVRSIDTYGFYLSESSLNTFTQNYIYSNAQGLRMDGPTTFGNKLYNNYFNNWNNAGVTGSNYGNTTKQKSSNIVGGPFVGGNYWAKPDGTGFSETCLDKQKDGFCDETYLFNGDNNNVDNLPLSRIQLQKLI
ncbi:MAG: NosD domain-containing protein [Nanoarchaeota archaeon]